MGAAAARDGHGLALSADPTLAGRRPVGVPDRALDEAPGNGGIARVVGPEVGVGDPVVFDDVVAAVVRGAAAGALAPHLG